MHTLFEKYSTGEYNCNGGKRAEKVRYFLKYLNQIALHKVNYGFGVSKTYRQSFVQETYGYGGGIEFWVINIKFVSCISKYSFYEIHLKNFKIFFYTFCR